MKAFLFRYLKFGSVGTAGSVINIAVFFLLTDLLGLDYRIASVLAIEIRIVCNFFMNLHWTWIELKSRPSRDVMRMFVNFNLSSLGLSLLVNWSVTVMLAELTGLNHNLANMGGLLVGNIGSIVNFLVSNFLIFKERAAVETRKSESYPRAANE